MLGAMSDNVLVESGTGPAKFGGKHFVNRRVAKRCSPCSRGQNGDGLARWAVANAENQDLLRQDNTGKNSAGNVSRVPVAGMWNQASFGRNFAWTVIRCGSVGADRGLQLGRIRGIKASGDGGKAKHGR